MYKLIFKRVIDIVLSSMFLVITLPVLLCISFLIKLDSRGPIIFKQARLGLNGRCFRIYKFRTMVDNAEKIGPKFTSNNDRRITKIGYLLRKTSLDELPQFINVIKGEMSLVGPRPDIFNEELDEFLVKRSSVKPGITGYAQVNGRSNLSKEERDKYDLEYVNNYCLLMDVKIILKTINIIILRKGTN
ncbi:sugar transferase [Bacillus sp. JJ1533]|uniref:sugar transferase n=1 Tax=Bacillus sp. JJ1533 TaxID=3122959 RepID=UPI002FFE21EF